MPRKPNTAKDHYHDPFPCALRELVDARNLTQEQLTEVLGVKSRQSVTGYLDGSTAPTADKIIALAKFFNVSADYLLGLSDDPKVTIGSAAAARYLHLSDLEVRKLAEILNPEKWREVFISLIRSDLLLKIIQMVLFTRENIKLIEKKLGAKSHYEARHIQRDLADDLSEELMYISGYSDLEIKIKELEERIDRGWNFKYYAHALDHVQVKDQHDEHQEN